VVLPRQFSPYCGDGCRDLGRRRAWLARRSARLGIAEAELEADVEARRAMVRGSPRGDLEAPMAKAKKKAKKKRKKKKKKPTLGSY